MALAKSGGTIKKKISGDQVPPSTDPEITTNEVVVHPTPVETLASEVYIKNTIDGLNVIEEPSPTLAILAQYATGSTIQVTWYHHMNTETFGRSFESDISLALDNAHYCLLKINNFEMKLTDSINFEYNTGDVTSAIAGSAIVYPYFVPYQGDLFLYEVEPGHIGLFKVAEAPTRLSIREGTYHRITFVLVAWHTPEWNTKLEACVEDVAYFDVNRFLTTKGSLLSSDEKYLQTDIAKWIGVLTTYFCENFYDKRIFQTFVEDPTTKEEIPYDPYLVEFISRIIPISNMPGYPNQLVSDPLHWKRSLWFQLLDPEMVPNEILISKVKCLIHKVTYRTTRINALTNRPYIELTLEEDNVYSYPPFELPEEYNTDPENITVPEQVKLYIVEHKVHPAHLIDLCKSIFTKTREEQYYYIAVLLFLLKKTHAALRSGATNVILKNTP